jgi:hypothetical protein
MLVTVVEIYKTQAPGVVKRRLRRLDIKREKFLWPH